MSNSFSSTPMVYEKNAFSTPFLRGYKLLKIPIVDAFGNPAWPELFPLEKVTQMREIVGQRHFSAQMMLEFVPSERARLDPGGIHFYDDEFEPRNAHLGDSLVTGCVLYWDPSSGRRGRDGSACVLLYRDDRARYIFIHDILYLTVAEDEQYPLSRQCDCVLDFMRNCGISRITIETNGIGGGLPEIMRNCAASRGANIYVHRVQNYRAKSERILDAIEPVLSTGRLYAHTRVMRTPLMSEMIGWSPMGGAGIHDDGLDAVAGAISQTPIPVRPVGSMARPFTANTNFKI